MRFKLIVSNTAHRDLDEILNNMKALYTRDAAICFAEALEECYERLSSNPLMFAFSNTSELAGTRCRRALVQKYTVLYNVDKEGQCVYIHSFFCSTRNYIDTP